MSENRFDAVRELVKDPSLRVTEIAWKTGYNKGHVSRLRKAAMRQELCREEIMSENKTAKTPTDSGVGFIDGVWHGPTAWQCQCGKAYTVTCISSKPAKREWVGLTDEECINSLPVMPYEYEFNVDALLEYTKIVEAKLREKNT